MFAALRECNAPFFENTPNVFTDSLGYCSPCAPGEKWSNAASMCVLDTNIDVTPSTFDYKYLLYGLGIILLLGAFAGGRASKSSGVTSGTRKRVTKSFWVTF